MFDATVSVNPRPSSIFSSMVCNSLSVFFLGLSLSLSLSVVSDFSPIFQFYVRKLFSIIYFHIFHLFLKNDIIHRCL